MTFSPEKDPGLEPGWGDLAANHPHRRDAGSVAKCIVESEGLTAPSRGYESAIE